jgi:hypothetical protein
MKANDVQPQAALTGAFPENVKKAIGLLSKAGFIESTEFMDMLVNNGIHEPEATEIFLFLPIAFVRHLLPRVKWHDVYVEELADGKEVERKYNETESYMVIDSVTTEYFKNSPDPDTVVKIGGRSSEFQVIQELLLKHPTAQPEDISLGPTVIKR